MPDKPDIIGREEIDELQATVKFLACKDGRRLAYYEYGDPSGTPIIFAHGTGSHVHVMLLHHAAKRKKFRIIVPDRPGVGQSDFQPGRKILDGAADIAALADHLGIGKFGVMGISGGGPTVLACAYSLADRLLFAVDLAGAVPLYRDPEALKKLGTMDRFYAKIGAKLPLWLFQVPFSLIGFQMRTMKSPQAFVKMMGSSMCKPDMDLFLMPDMAYILMRDFQELFLKGAKGPSYDAQVIYLDWGFDLSKIKTRVEIRHGTEDRWVPLMFSEWLSKTVPGARLTAISGQGHFYHMAYGDETLGAAGGLL